MHFFESCHSTPDRQCPNVCLAQFTADLPDNELRILAMQEARNSPIFYIFFHISVKGAIVYYREGGLGTLDPGFSKELQPPSRGTQKMSILFFSHFQFQVCHQRVLFKFTFFHIWTTLQKIGPQNFDKLHMNKFSFKHSKYP